MRSSSRRAALADARTRMLLVAIATACALTGAVIALRPAEVADAAAAVTPDVRDPRRWPFAWDSIWNMPIGTQASLVPAGIPAAGAYGMTVDEDVLVLQPDAPRTQVVANSAGWNPNLTRCGTVDSTKVLLRDVPLPAEFSTESYLGRTPNMSAALLLGDGVTIAQTQPFHRCGAGGAATSQYVYPSDDIRTGDGIAGAHGGSGMSSMGGTVRLGELVPGGVIRHALKINLDCARLCAYAPTEPDGRPGYRWPARKADSDAAGRYRGPIPALQMGSLLTLPASFDEAQLRTEPARIMARALRDHGAYVVDDTGWDVYALATEWSPEGRVIDEFAAAWGFPMSTPALATCTGTEPSCAWAKDMAALYTSLHVVDDNTADTIGGAGARRAGCAPPFADGSGGAPSTCGPPDPTTTTAPTTAPPTTAP
ncbi:MAG: hypothetical protein IT196_16480, partial [Acidimicrobiales bacterium]|nr:hypothetical protein [Acidimicrobiales bacterium]